MSVVFRMWLMTSAGVQLHLQFFRIIAVMWDIGNITCYVLYSVPYSTACYALVCPVWGIHLSGFSSKQQCRAHVRLPIGSLLATIFVIGPGTLYVCM